MSDGSIATAELEQSMIETQLEKLERSVAPRPPAWAWALVIIGIVAALALTVHAFTVYLTISHVLDISRLDTPNPLALFQELATNGPRVSSSIDGNSRNLYGRALTQYVLDGTGICLGIALAVAGLFIRVNR
jgi:hypothetical protein